MCPKGVCKFGQSASTGAAESSWRTTVSTVWRAHLWMLAIFDSVPHPTVTRPRQTSPVITMTTQFDVLNFPNDSRSAHPNLRRCTGPTRVWHMYFETWVGAAQRTNGKS